MQVVHGDSGGSEHGMEVGTERQERLLHPRPQPPDSGLWVTDPQLPWTTESGGNSCHLPRGRWVAASVGAGHPSSGSPRT